MNIDTLIINDSEISESVSFFNELNRLSNEAVIARMQVERGQVERGQVANNESSFLYNYIAEKVLGEV